jgi:hypothetical protein
LAAGGDHQVVLDADADALLLGGDALGAACDVQAAFDGEHRAGFVQAELAANSERRGDRVSSLLTRNPRKALGAHPICRDQWALQTLGADVADAAVGGISIHVWESS